jgi:hypothetical protein
VVRKLIAMLIGSMCLYVAVPSGAVPLPPSHSGCCSHHQGVCGCSAGHTQCCDGEQSPSCTC